MSSSSAHRSAANRRYSNERGGGGSGSHRPAPQSSASSSASSAGGTDDFSSLALESARRFLATSESSYEHAKAVAEAAERAADHAKKQMTGARRARDEARELLGRLERASVSGGGGSSSRTARSAGGSSRSKEPPFATGASTGKAFHELYVLGKNLGEGAFSAVKEGTHKPSNQSFAIKIVTKSKLSKEDTAALKDEINLLRELGTHDHIIRLYDVFDESQYYYLVTERMMGGELFDRIVAKAYYNEKEARDACRILFEAMAFCHSRRVAHRDLKPENLLLRTERDDSDIKIADFGFAKRCPTVKCLTTQCGTPGYVAPEILEGVQYGTKADMWSLGVIAYILLGGYPPFIEQNQRDLFRKIRKGQYEFHPEYWGRVSKEAKDLIASMLTVDPDRRISAEQALRNSWITAGDEALAGKDLGKNLEALLKFNTKRKFKAAVKAVIASNKMTSLGENFKQNIQASY